MMRSPRLASLLAATFLGALGLAHAACSGCAPLSTVEASAELLTLDAATLSASYALSVHAPEQTCGGVCNFCGAPTLQTRLVGNLNASGFASDAQPIVRIEVIPKAVKDTKDTLLPALPVDVVLDTAHAKGDFVIDIVRDCVDGEECDAVYDVSVTRVDSNPEGSVIVALETGVSYTSSPDGTLTVELAKK